jgi:hypothetical protein
MYHLLLLLLELWSSVLAAQLVVMWTSWALLNLVVL